MVWPWSLVTVLALLPNPRSADHFRNTRQSGREPLAVCWPGLIPTCPHQSGRRRKTRRLRFSPPITAGDAATKCAHTGVGRIFCCVSFHAATHSTRLVTTHAMAATQTLAAVYFGVVALHFRHDSFCPFLQFLIIFISGSKTEEKPLTCLKFIPPVLMKVTVFLVES